MRNISFIATLAIGLLDGGRVQADLWVLELEHRHQEASKWCWAACSEMVLEYYDISVTQCELAQLKFWNTECDCDAGNKNALDCNRPGWPTVPCEEYEWETVTIFECYGLKQPSRTHDKALSWSKVKKQIKTEAQPVLFSWRYLDEEGEPTEIGHMMVLIGCGEVDGKKYVAYWDPNEAIGTDFTVRPYAEYVKGDGYVHWDDFYDLGR